jgi:hypothetical protein
MKIPDWVKDELEKFKAPATGRIEISMELYQGGVTKLELGETVRLKPPVRND